VKITQIFSEALGVEKADRERYIIQACDGEAELIDEVKSLIESYEMPSVLDKSIDSLRNTAFCYTEVNQNKGQKIGNYKIVEELGHGGMGCVWLAERADGEFSQRVALKLLRSAFATKNQVQRFKSERQILASLEHDNIARVLDGGVTQNGQPYYVMEFVDGQPIDSYCDKRRMSINERLKLFLQVCEAVQYAHRKLIVHRDLKPSNILITMDGRVKLLDFGIAKVLNTDNPDPSEVTLHQPGLLPLTPSYASPEQLRGDAITTASDIYQLGIVLHELLTGFLPYNVDGQSPELIEKIICETVPLNSITINQNTEEVNKACKNRGTDPVKLKKKFRGDINAIILKALCKEPDRRYESAEQLLIDIQRHLAGKTVSAHSNSRVYRTKKFIGRNSVEITVVATVLVLMVGYLITITRYSHQTTAAFEQAQREADKSAQVVDFMLGMFEAGDPRTDPGQLITAQALLEQGVEEANQLQNQPVLQANMFNVIGRVYTSLGHYNEAKDLLQKAVEIHRGHSEDKVETARYLNDLAIAETRLGNYEEAYLLHDEALEILKNEFGTEHQKVAQSMAQMGAWIPVTGIEKAAELRNESLRINEKIYGSNHLLTAESHMDVGKIQRSLAKPRDAINSFRRALEIRKNELGGQHPDVAESMIFLADVYRLYHLDLQKAELLYRDALNIQERALGTGHLSQLHAITGLASLYSEIGNHSEAIMFYERNLEIRRTVFGENHPSVAEGLGHLGSGYLKAKNPAKAEQYYRQCLTLWEETVGSKHIVVSGALIGLGDALTELEKFDEAESIYLQSLDIQRYHLGEESGALVIGALGKLSQKRGEIQAAERHYRQAISMMEKDGASDHYDALRLKKELDSLLVIRE